MGLFDIGVSEIGLFILDHVGIQRCQTQKYGSRIDEDNFFSFSFFLFSLSRKVKLGKKIQREIFVNN